MDAAVHVDGLLKVFDVPEREQGLVAATKSLVRRKTKAVRAVDEISFRIEPGEVVGFLGPNGAGKTTTLKMLSGLLYPTGGEALVLGLVPSKRQREFLSRITLVMGNRNQLQWDLPALDSFELNRAIYRIPRDEFVPMRDELVELLDIGDLVRKPIRNLSLGERMKAEIVGALLHRPQVLFLDEPTIGLDVTMQKRIRTFVADYNARFGATVLLTSHYMADVEALCKRVVVIHHGRILYDGPLAGLADTVRRLQDDRRRPRERAGGPLPLRRGHPPRRRLDHAARAEGRDLEHHRPPPRRGRGARPERRGPAHRGRDRARLRTGAPGVTTLPHAAPRAEAGRVRSMVDLYVTTARAAIQTEFQYRTGQYFFMLGMVAEPVIYLVVWTTIAEQQGGSVQGLTAGYFAAYYIVWTLVRNMNVVFGAPYWEYRIREGDLNRDLLRPVLPLHFDIAWFAGWKVVTIVLWLPIAVALSLLFDPTLDPRPAEIATFAIAIWGAYLLRTMLQESLGMLCFWTTRGAAIFDLYMMTELLLSGPPRAAAAHARLGAGDRALPPLPVGVLLPDREPRRRPLERGARPRARRAAPLDPHRARDLPRGVAVRDSTLLGGGRLT